MNTLIELYDERAIENILAPDMFRPRRIVYLCPGEIAQDRTRQETLAAFFRRRGWEPELIFVETSLFKADRILRQLSAACAAQMENILWDYDILVHLDVIFARAQLSYQLNASRPEVRRRGGVTLRRARHPLLDQAKAVPITVELGQQFDTLVITGPNTGGKTVTLKTIGLLCLMAQCGLHVPADSGSAVRVFHRVLADVGDEQSIEQSLSTFSAHMSNIVQILREVDDQSLLLFDELGAGTDPIEGAALAIAIIESARSQGALIAATTHYAELKTFALTTDGVENASSEFDVQSLQPTYRLLTGIPGKSNAFAISRRLGLPEYIIDKAADRLDAENVRFEDVLTKLDQQRQEMEKEQRQAAQQPEENTHIKHCIPPIFAAAPRIARSAFRRGLRPPLPCLYTFFSYAISTVSYTHLTLPTIA